MKIWIVSSYSFSNDFERLAECWSTNDDIYITSVKEYSFSLKAFYSFYKQYLSIKPNVILTDVGYLGFLPVRVHNKIFRTETPITFILRGNYWLEERSRRGKLSPKS